MDPENKITALSPIERSLRMFCVCSWIVSFPFLLSHGIVSEKVCPALGIIPATFSSIFGVVHLYDGAKSRFVRILMDVFLASFFIGILIPSWIELASSWRQTHGQTMLGTYATVPLMASFVIHVFLVLREIKFSLPSKTCPHCHGDLRPSRKPHMQRSMYRQARQNDDDEHSHESKEYIDQVDNDAQPMGQASSSSSTPRPSTDDETARLV